MSIIILLFTQNALSASLCFGVFLSVLWFVLYVLWVVCLFFFLSPGAKNLKATAVHDWLTCCLSFVVLERNVNDPYMCGLNFST